MNPNEQTSDWQEIGSSMTISGVELLPGGAWKVGGFTLTPNSPWDISTLGGVEIQKEEGEGKEIRIRDGDKLVSVRFAEGLWRMRIEEAPHVLPNPQRELQSPHRAESEPGVVIERNQRLPLIALAIVVGIVMSAICIIWYKTRPNVAPQIAYEETVPPNEDDKKEGDKDSVKPSEGGTSWQKDHFFIPDKPTEPVWGGISELGSGFQKWSSNMDVWEMNDVTSRLLLFPNGDFRLSGSDYTQDFKQSHGVDNQQKDGGGRYIFGIKVLNDRPRIRIFKNPGIGEEMEIDRAYGIQKDPWAVDSGLRFNLRYFQGAWQMKKVIQAFTPPPALPEDLQTTDEWAKVEEVVEENGRFHAQRAKFHRFPFKKSPADPTKYEEEGGMGYTLYPNGDVSWQADISQGFGFPNINKYSKGTIRYEGGHWQVKRREGAEPLVEYAKPQTQAAPERISKGEVAKWDKVETPLKISNTLELLPSGEMKVLGVVQPQDAEIEISSGRQANPPWNYHKKAGAGKMVQIDKGPGELVTYQFDPVMGWMLQKKEGTQRDDGKK